MTREGIFLELSLFELIIDNRGVLYKKQYVYLNIEQWKVM